MSGGRQLRPRSGRAVLMNPSHCRVNRDIPVDLTGRISLRLQRQQDLVPGAVLAELGVPFPDGPLPRPELGRQVPPRQPSPPVGYRKLLEWLQAFGTISVVAVEGTSSYDAGLTRTLQAAGVSVVEVDRPNRQVRRRQGKSDALDAIAAARSVLAGTALGAPKTKGENVQGIRVLAVVRQTATKATTQALNQIRSLVSTAPGALRKQLRAPTITQTIATCAAHQPGPARMSRPSARSPYVSWPAKRSTKTPNSRRSTSVAPRWYASSPRPDRSLRCRTRHSRHAAGPRR